MSVAVGQARPLSAIRTCPRRHVVLLPQALERFVTSVGASDDPFEEFLAANPLPGTFPSSSTQSTGLPRRLRLGAGSGGANTEPRPHTQLRFHWSSTPAIAQLCTEKYGNLQWSLQSPGLLVGCPNSSSSGGGSSSSGSSSGGSGIEAQPVVELELPWLLAGMQGSLFSRHLPELSPLMPCAGAEHAGLLAALDSLGQAEAPGRQLRIGDQLVVLLSADSAALALFSEGRMTRHKVLTGYTIRKKQGKAQAAYERQGGGARSVGGSLRARETRRLFQGAAGVLDQWRQDIEGCNLLFKSGTVRVWNELHASTSPPPPIDRRDPRWQTVGVGVRRPRLADVERVYEMLSHGCLWTYP